MGASRWAPLSGVVFVVLWVIAFLLVGEGAGDSDKEILAYYADKGHRDREMALFFLVTAASLFFLWFVAVLRGRLARAEGRAGALTTLAFGAGVASAALWIVAGGLFSIVAMAHGDKDFVLDPNTYRLFNDLGYSVFVSANMVSIALVFCTALIAVRTAIVPKWIGWLSFVVSVALVVSIAFFPFLVLLGWVLVISIALIARPAERAGMLPAPATG